MSAIAHKLSAPIGDYLSLLKPRITMMVVITAAMGMFVAPGEIDWETATAALLTIAAVVAGANSLNCWLERDSDRLMDRTSTRPLPEGRLHPNHALVLGLILGLGAVSILAWQINLITGLLGAIALFTYVLIYTPLKRFSGVALHVGSIPGALPPLMGYTAITGKIDISGMALFAVLFVWQIPHFMAIAIYREEEYVAAGLRTVPADRGHLFAKVQAAIYAAALVPLSMLLFVSKTSGPYFFAITAIAGVAFTLYGVFGLTKTEKEEENVWARKYFRISLLYLTLFSVALVLDS